MQFVAGAGPTSPAGEQQIEEAYFRAAVHTYTYATRMCVTLKTDIAQKLPYGRVSTLQNDRNRTD